MRTDDVERLLRAAERALTHDGDLGRARILYGSAYLSAEAAGEVTALAGAALGLGGLWVHERRTATDAAMVKARQRHALTLLDRRSPLALRLRARLAAENDYLTGSSAAITGLLAEARACGDPVVLAETLSLALHCLLGPAATAAHAPLAAELVAVSACTARRGDRLMALLWQAADHLLRGSPVSLAGLRAELAAGDHLAVSFVVSAIDVMRAIRAGHFARAERLAERCAQRGFAAGDIDAVGWYCEQLATIRWYQGRIVPLIPVMTELANSSMLSAVDSTYLAGLAVASASAGDRRTAIGLLHRLRSLPQSSSWMLSMHCLAEAAHLLGDRGTATRVRAALLPYADLPVISSLGVTCLGSAQHALGLTAWTLADVVTAVAHFRLAVEANERLGHRPATALSRWRLSQALGGDEGAEQAKRAREEAAALGMRLPEGCVAAGVVAECHRRGRFWQLDLGERGVLVEHSVGLRHLATLIANPGTEIRAIDLAAGPGTAESDGEHAQAVLDEQARRTYRLRLDQLREELPELESGGDEARAAELRAERDWLSAELAVTTGKGGRARMFSGSEERARIAVGKAVRRALARVERADPVLAAELRASVRTGVRCCYRPAGLR